MTNITESAAYDKLQMQAVVTEKVMDEVQEALDPYATWFKKTSLNSIAGIISNACDYAVGISQNSPLQNNKAVLIAKFELPENRALMIARLVEDRAQEVTRRIYPNLSNERHI
jgi:hypothetical protein